jgi:hypothetical protein
MRAWKIFKVEYGRYASMLNHENSIIYNDGINTAPPNKPFCCFITESGAIQFRNWIVGGLIGQWVIKEVEITEVKAASFVRKIQEINPKVNFNKAESRLLNTYGIFASELEVLE